MSVYGSSTKAPGQNVRYFEWNAVVNGIDDLYFNDSPFMGRDKIPREDGKFSIGSPNARLKNIYSLWGYFDSDCFVQGKRVIKDGDPVNIYDIFIYARTRITEAIDKSSVPGKLDVQIIYLEQIKADIESGVTVKDYSTTAQNQLKTTTRDAIIEAIKQDLQDIKAKLDEVRAEIDELYTKTFSDVFTGLSGSGSMPLFYPGLGRRIETRSWFLHSDSTKGVFFLRFPVSNKYIGALFCTRSGVSQHNRAHILGNVDEPIELLWDGIDVNSSIIVQITYKED